MYEKSGENMMAVLLRFCCSAELRRRNQEVRWILYLNCVESLPGGDGGRKRQQSKCAIAQGADRNRACCRQDTIGRTCQIYLDQ